MIRRSVDYRRDLTNQIRLCKVGDTPILKFTSTIPELLMRCLRLGKNNLASRFNLMTILSSSVSTTTLFLRRRYVDGDPGLRPLLGHGQRDDLRGHPVQRPGLCGRAQAGAEGEDGLNVCVWKAAAPRRSLLLRLPLLLLLVLLLVAVPSPSAAALEPVLNPTAEVAESGGRC